MNKTNIFTVLFFLTITFFTQKTNAQITIGGGLAYGTEIESAGVNVTGQYFFNENIAIAPSFTYYFPKSTFGDFSFKWYEINADVNYYFKVPDSKIKPYGLAGLNYSIITFPSIDFGFFGGSTESSSNGELGFNLGGGAGYDLGKKITPFAQLKYTISSFDQLTIMAGIRYEI